MENGSLVMTYAETGLVATIERLTGDELAALTQAQRDELDQFHGGGTEAVDRMLTALRLEPGLTVLDVGSGLGGPARQVARTSGATVVGVDITPAYVEAAETITHAAGLDGQVTFMCSDIAALERTDFDAAYTMHVQMNIADKQTFFNEIARHLRPGARLATFEVCRTDEARPSLPLPWSLDGTDSFLATADELRDTIQASGFEIIEWAEETVWIREWFEQIVSRMAEGGTAATLPALLDDGPLRMLNFAAGVADGTFTVHRGTFTRTP
jgi:ubiquinone/menaquinone biosynthesis C-methylase UbiE